MGNRVYVFKQAVTDKITRPRLYAFHESEIHSVESQVGSQNCYLVVNGKAVQGSFDEFVDLLGERCDIK